MAPPPSLLPLPTTTTTTAPAQATVITTAAVINSTVAATNTNTTTNPRPITPPAPTILTLPSELRLKIYSHILSPSPPSFRPQRKLGWNKPHADLRNPALLFESDSHPTLRALFHHKLCKPDHLLILTHLLHTAKVLVVDHTDFAALQRIIDASGGSGRAFAGVVKQNLRWLDFADKLDEIVCQPGDLVRLLKGLGGVKGVWLMTRHVQRYQGGIGEHVEFARERAEREVEVKRKVGEKIGAGEGRREREKLRGRRRSSAGSEGHEGHQKEVDEFRRLHLRSPMTDGTRMMISPAVMAGSGLNRANNGHRWVVVDLSMLVWQHFLYTGAPYKDHWRCVKMNTLLKVAEKKGINVVMGFRNIEFDPSSDDRQGSNGGSVSTPWSSMARDQRWLRTVMYRAEMSSSDWILRLKQRVVHGKDTGAEFTVRQRKVYDETVSQEGCGLVRY